MAILVVPFDKIVGLLRVDGHSASWEPPDGESFSSEMGFCRWSKWNRGACTFDDVNALVRSGMTGSIGWK